MPYASSLGKDETPSNLASHLDPSCLTIGKYFQTLSDIEELWKLKQTRNLEDNLFCGLRVKRYIANVRNINFVLARLVVADLFLN